MLLKRFTEMASWVLFGFILVAMRGCKTRGLGASEKSQEPEHLHRWPQNFSMNSSVATAQVVRAGSGAGASAANL